MSVSFSPLKFSIRSSKLLHSSYFIPPIHTVVAAINQLCHCVYLGGQLTNNMKTQYALFCFALFTQTEGYWTTLCTIK